MNEDVLVSVIIPVFNRELTIEMAVRSVLSQTYSNLELIVVDDCSTDKSVEVVQRIKDERIRVIVCDKNRGACAARNIGIKNSKGEIIAFQDSDDCWHKDKLEKSLFYLKEKHADMVFSALYPINSKKEKRIPSYNLNFEKDKLTRLLISNCISTQTIVIRKQVTEKVRFDEELPRFQDWDFGLQVLKNRFSVFYIDEPLVDYYMSNDSITKNVEKGIRAYEIIQKKYEEEYKSNKTAKYGLYCRMASFLDKTGNDGTVYMKKAYEVRKNKSMLIRYYLAKFHLYHMP